MAKADGAVKKQNRVNLENLSQRDSDILTLDTQEVMNKYNLEKQPVYDRRFALNKKIKAAGLTIEQVTNKTASVQAPKKGRPKKVSTDNNSTETVEPIVQESHESVPRVQALEKQVPVVMKPIEMNFENFSIKLNGIPKKISVNPDTNSIEIDL
jgi:hypothetical protein